MSEAAVEVAHVSKSYHRGGTTVPVLAFGLLVAMLLARIYEVFPLLCPRCEEAMRLIAFVTDSGSITRILAYLGDPTKAPYIAPPPPEVRPMGRRTSIRAKALRSP